MKVVIDGAVAGLGVVGLGREHDEARRVVHLVLDVVGQDLEAVDLGGERGGDRGEGRILRLAHHARRARRIGLGHRLQAELDQLAAALAQRLRVAQDALDGLQAGAGRGHQLVAHAQEVLADDVEIGFGQQVVDIGDAARHRVLDGDHGVARLARPDREQRILEGRTGDRLETGISLAAGKMRVGAGLALIDDALGGGLGSGCAALRRRAFMAGRWRTVGHGLRG